MHPAMSAPIPVVPTSANPGKKFPTQGNQSEFCDLNETSRDLEYQAELDRALNIARDWRRV